MAQMKFNGRVAYLDAAHTLHAPSSASARTANAVIRFQNSHRKSAQLENRTTSGSILSLLSRDQDVTMRPHMSQSLSVEERNMA